MAASHPLHVRRGPAANGRADGAAGSARLSLLDAFRLDHAGHELVLPGPAQRLLAYLALRRRPVLRDHAAEELWLDSSQQHALGSLRSALWKLRRPTCRLVRVSGPRLEVAPELAVDVHEALSWAHWMLDSAEDKRMLDLGGLAYPGEILPDWYDDWVILERERFRLLRLQALEELCDRLLLAGLLARALEAALTAVHADPLRESAQRALIRVHLAQGNVAEAVDQYQRFRTRLYRELGLVPSALMRELLAVSAAR
jgi:DNA-binding SARP family transcriptional activator